MNVALKLKTGKIVGAISLDSWAQTYIFLPSDSQKKEEYGILAVCLAFTSLKEGLDIASFGKEVINRLWEIYYASLEKGKLLRLKKSLNQLIEEFKEKISLEITAAVFLTKPQPALYLAIAGKGKVVIWRQKQLAEILKGEEGVIKTSSGLLEDNDIFILATEQFFQKVEAKDLQNAFQANLVDKIKEILSALVHRQNENSQTAAVILKVRFIPQKSEISSKQENQSLETALIQENLKKEKISLKERIKKYAYFLKNLILLAKKFLLDYKKQPEIYLPDKEKKIKAQKITLLLAVFLVIFLSFAIIWGGKQGIDYSQRKIKNKLEEEINKKIEEAISLKEINPLQAKSLLREVHQTLEKEITLLKEGKTKENLKELLGKLEIEEEKIAKNYKVENPEVFLDLTLFKENFKGFDWDKGEEGLLILDEKTGVVLEVGLDTKKAKIVAGGDELKEAKKIGAGKNKIYVLKKKKLLLIDKETGKVVDEKTLDKEGDIKTLTGFADNAYLLDCQQGKIWKYTTLGKKLTSAKNYFNKESYNLEDCQEMAIDGSIWVLFKQGDVFKFTSGLKDVYQTSGLEKEFEQTESIYTDEDLENLYILDKNNSRIVIFSKTSGDYQAQYSWQGMVGVYDLYADEKEKMLLLLTGERIYKITLKD